VAAGTHTWADLVENARRRLDAAGVANSRIEARWLVEEVSGQDGVSLDAACDEGAPVRAVARVDALLARRAAGEPLQYVLGHWAFRRLDLYVDRRVLIPRPETEVVCGYALDEVDRIATSLIGGDRQTTPPREIIVVDLGTGSGAIALSVAAERSCTTVWAVDESPDALDVARANLAGLGRAAARVRIAEGSWYEALPNDVRGGVDLIVANPPYVAVDEALPREVDDWEPTHALVAGSTGLEAIELIVAEAPQWLVDDGSLVVEIGETQGDAVLGLARAAGFADVSVQPDLTGRPRALVARRSR
jgi:release factor glutamine methyltransferase